MARASLGDSAPGGMLDDVEATITKAVTGPYTYTSGKTAQGLILDFKTPDGAEHQEFYSSGAAVPTEDGAGFETTPKDNSKAKKLIMKMIALKVAVGDTVKVFEGIHAHWVRSALEKMPGLKDDDGSNKTILLPDRILPKKATAPAKAAAAAKPATAAKPVVAAAASNGDLNEAAITVIKEVLAGKGGDAVTLPKLSTDVMLKCSKSPEHKPNMVALKKMAADAAFLEANMDGNWVYDAEAGTVTAWPE